MLTLNEDYFTKKASRQFTTRQLAPECIKSLTFNEKTDVWSFGLVVWEIYTNGATAFSEIYWESPHDFLKILENGAKPDMSSLSPTCNLKVFQLISDCLEIDPKRRPKFKDIQKYC